MDILGACVDFAQVHKISFSLSKLELLIRVAQCSFENCQDLEKVEAEGLVTHVHSIGLFWNDDREIRTARRHCTSSKTFGNPLRKGSRTCNPWLCFSNFPTLWIESELVEEKNVQRGVFICSYLITRAASESVWYEDARVLLGLNCMLLWRPPQV